MAFDIRLLPPKTSAPSHFPELTYSVDPPFKIVGGGAVINYTGAGSLLTASYPKDIHTWYAAGKDHEVPDEEAITVYVLALYDPNDDWDVIIVQGVCASPASYPWARVRLPEPYVLTGGGAFVDWHGDGNLLTASYPYPSYLDTSGNWVGWEARSKDHQVSDPSTITAYAIGIRASCTNSLHPTVKNYVVGVQSPVSPVPVPPPVIESHPRADGTDPEHPKPCLGAGGSLTRSGGGAIDNWGGEGNLLTASYPDPTSEQCWVAKGKDHIVSSPAYITAYVIGIGT
jgi:hypothetical protein